MIVDAWKVEMEKALRSKGFLMALLAGTLLVILQFSWFYRNTYLANQQEYEYVTALSYLDENYGSWFATTLLEGWIGCENYSPYHSLFFLAFPLLAAVPYGASLCGEWKSGYAMQMVIRCGRGRYLFTKFAATFASGGLAVSLPLLFSLLLSVCLLPAVGTDPMSLQAAIANHYMWAPLFFEHPVWYALCYTALDFCFGGIFACMALTASRWSSGPFGAVMFPMLFYGILYYGVAQIAPEFHDYNLASYISPGQEYGANRFEVLAPVSLAVLAVLTILYFLGNRRRDALGR